MADKISNKNIAEKSTKISLKTPSDFQSPSNRQEIQSSTEFDGSTISACFIKILENLQQNRLTSGNLHAVLTNNQAKNINEITDELKKKLETLTTNLSRNKKVVRQVGECHFPAEDELSLYGCSDLDELVDRLVDTTKNPKVNFVINNNDSESEERDENYLIKEIANNFSAVEKTGPPKGKNLANIINNVMFNSAIREKLVQELQKKIFENQNMYLH